MLVLKVVRFSMVTNNIMLLDWAYLGLVLTVPSKLLLFLTLKSKVLRDRVDNK